MKNSKLLMGTAPLLVLLSFLFLSPAKASVDLNNAKFSSTLEFNQGSLENNTVSSDRKKKKKKKKKVHCEAFKN